MDPRYLPHVLAAIAVVQTLAFAQTTPTLVDVVQLTKDARQEQDPCIAFSDSAPAGVVTWGKRVGFGSLNNNHQDMYAATFDGNAWSAEGFVPNQADLARHLTFSSDFRPGTSRALVAFQSSANQPIDDETRARVWDSSTGWNPSGPIFIGDGLTDDDVMGSVRFAADGSYALCAWEDTPTPNDKSAIVVSVFDPTTDTFLQPPTVVAPWGGTPPRRHLWHDRSLAQDPVTGKWVVVYRRANVYFGPGITTYAVGQVSGLTPSFGAEVSLSPADELAMNATVSFTDDGMGAILYSQPVDGGDYEIMAATWNGGGFSNPVQLTANDRDDLVQQMVPASGGWHVFYTAPAPCETDMEIYHAFFDGVSLGASTRLTADSSDQDDVDAAVDSNGDIHLAWLSQDGSDLSSVELSVGRLDPNGAGLGFDTYGAGCAGLGGFVPHANGAGDTSPGGDISLSVCHGVGGGNAFLLLGTQPGAVPMGGGCSLLVSPPIGPIGPIPLTGSGAGAGTLLLPATIPATAPQGVSVYLQWFVTDAAGALGFSSTNGLEVTFL